MATSGFYAPSRRMRSAAVAERSRVERELARLDIRHRALVEELGTLDSTREDLHDQLRMLNRFVHDFPERADEPRPPKLSVVAAQPRRSNPAAVLLRGARIREAAVRVLASAPEASGPVHYRTWFELFTRQGFMPAGKDPLATFLTQVGRSPVVERTSGGGTYQLDFGFPRKAHARLAELQNALRSAHELPADASVELIGAARERRTELTVEIERTERALEEALRSLGAAAAVGA